MRIILLAARVGLIAAAVPLGILLYQLSGLLPGPLYQIAHAAVRPWVDIITSQVH